MTHKKCIVCGNQQSLKFSLKHHVFQCSSCGLYSSDAVFEMSFQTNLEENNREIGLKKLRFHNFELIIKQLKENYFKGKNKILGLEIGSGNGWWLEVCKQNNVECIGIEPEGTFRDYYEKNNLKVIEGFYPVFDFAQTTKSNFNSENRYDFIIFNDVFEHISDLEDLISNLKKDLKKDGLLIINLPMSEGFFYKIAEFLYLFRMNSYLERLWQFHFHSPHIHYFNQKTLSAYLDKYDFKTINDFRLETLDFSSIKERIMADSTISKFRAYFLSTVLLFLKPIIQKSNPDIKVFFFRQK